ncbi:hypothetical protein K503DRAFT_773116 [Rhizopogon vinicolor AM-OR11-026]|uniref:Senescence domain-containing protein n=1 Tax=Rhizopogon vinicolor AM-OR11-026 TaxID=1314800 RepID=A0A1B7MT82_9AGAM|nr:hypothetical protein K503DRAFT_773116 [Rhizopogon vinicolor AM-OR11-026]
MPSEVFTLLNLPDATLTTPGFLESGVLALKCVTAQAGDVQDREVYLVIRLNFFECPIDPTRPVYFSFDAQLGRRSYSLSSPDGSTLGLVLPLTTEPDLLEDQDTFHGILAQYAEMRDSTTGIQDLNAPAASPAPPPSQQGLSGGHEAMRGRLILIDENNGEIVGELDNTMNINEDPSLSIQGRETDPVVIELPEDGTRMAVALAIPPEDQDWIIKSASFASNVITGTTNLLLTTMTHASSYYINHSTPHPSVGSSSSGAATGTPLPPPPRALVFLTSESARKGLSTVHTMSAQAATLSTKTVSLLDSMIKRAVGSNKKAQFQPSQDGTPRSSLSPKSTSPQPPPYSKGRNLQQSHQSSSTYLTPKSSAPPLPPRSPSPSSLSSPYPSDNKSPLPLGQSGRSPSPQPGGTPGSSSPLPPLKLHHRLLLSADLILSSVDSSVKQFVEIGAQNLGRAVEHKYGAEAARSAGLITGATQNIVAVYIDMRGIGRRAIVKRAGKEFLKARMSNRGQKGP